MMFPADVEIVVLPCGLVTCPVRNTLLATELLFPAAMVMLPPEALTLLMTIVSGPGCPPAWPSSKVRPKLPLAAETLFTGRLNGPALGEVGVTSR